VPNAGDHHYDNQSTMATFTVGSLFSGIGGLDLGLERAGMTVKWQCEVDPYCRRVLAKHWPSVPCYPDVRCLPDDIEPVDLICGGYPCQPFSVAGKRAGAGDPRHLWPYFADTLRLLRPEWALLENVPGHLGLGFDAVLADLAALGFDAEWELLPAAAFGAPHLRYRLFVVAHTRRISSERRRDAGFLGGEASPGTGETSQRQRLRDATGDSGENLADADGGRLQVGGEQNGGTDRSGQPASRRGDADRRGADVADTEGHSRWIGNRNGQADVAHAIRGSGRAEIFSDQADGQKSIRSAGRAGRSGWWAVEPDMGRVAHGIPRRVDRLRGLGNAVVPQVAEWIGRRILEAAA
jgi:DNA (cytosine-5)-methyltransferase 1